MTNVSEHNLLNNSYWLTRSFMPAEIIDQVQPYLLPYSHPAREILDHAYCTKKSFVKIDDGQHSTLKKLPELLDRHGLIIKEPNKDDQAKYTLQLRRVQAHVAAREYIDKEGIKYVKVTQSWIYPLPETANICAYFAYKVTPIVEKILNTLQVASPQWLKYGDSILRDRFVVIEEHINIERPGLNFCNSLPKSITDEWRAVFEVAGFQDVHELNYSLAKDGTITLFDLDQYSMKKSKNIYKGQLGISILFPDRYPWPGLKA